MSDGDEGALNVLARTLGAEKWVWPRAMVVVRS